MKPVEIKATTFGDVIERLKAKQAAYEALSPEERAKVDARNAAMTEGLRTGGIKGGLAATKAFDEAQK